MSSIPPAPVAPNPQPGTPDWLKGLLLIGGAIAAGALVGGAINALTSASRRTPRRPSLPPPSPYDFLNDLTLGGDSQLALNREKGTILEDRVARKLRRDFPYANVVRQVPVTTPDGKKRRVDFALAHANGSVTPVEVKNVPQLREKHVKQAEDHRAGLKNTHGVRSGPPIVAVPTHTIVSEEHAARVRILRVRSRAKGTR